MKPTVFFCSLLFLLSAPITAQTVDSNYIDGEIYVKYRNDFPVDFSQEYVEAATLPGFSPSLVAQYGIVQARFSFNKIPDIQLQKTVRVKFTAIERADDLVWFLSGLPFVEYAEKIPLGKLSYTPNDYGPKWPWYLEKIKARNAWDSAKGDRSIVIAVVDDEIDINHQDLKNAIWKNPGEIPNNGIDDDKNGYIDDVNGWDVSDNDNTVDNNSNSNLDHGTRSAGVIAAITDNTTGVASIGFNLSILPVKISYDATNIRAHYHIYEGLAYAATMNPSIINCSCGGSSNTSTGRNVVNYILSKDIPLIASAHNYNNSTKIYPAAYPGVISVAATEFNDYKASFSNYGNWVNISAPGVELYTLKKDNQYGNYGGTSGAAPIVSGLLGLMKSYRPAISNADLKTCLFQSADNIDNLNPSYAGQLGSGRINAYKALRCLDSLKTTPPRLKISISEKKVCPAKTIILKATSANTMDSLIWYLPGSTVPISKDTVVSIRYYRDSVYSLSIVAYNSFGKDSMYLQDYIEVNSTHYYTIFSEDFEDKNKTLNYPIINPDGKTTWTWSVAATSANNNNKAIAIFLSGYHEKGERDGFLLPPLDFTTVLKAQLNFQYSYCKGNMVSNDSLIVYASIDSGNTFPYKILAFGRPNLETSLYTQSFFFMPQGDNDWCFAAGNNCASISLDSLKGKKNVVLKFECYNDNGNTLFIDNINVVSNCSDIILNNPIADFNPSLDTICIGNKIAFTDKSILTPQTYQWLFPGGNPSVSYLQNPEVRYDSAGTFDVTLIVGNMLGYDTLVMKDYIRSVAHPVLVLADTQKYVCAGDSVHFTATGADSIVWYKHSSKQTVYGAVLDDKPVQNSLYSVRAVIKEGCYDSSAVRALYVPLPPAVSIFENNGTLLAQHNGANFTYMWYVNDSLITGSVGKSYKPLKTGNYKVMLTDSAGCTSVSPAVYFEYKTKSVVEAYLLQVAVYPNPATGSLFIDGLNRNTAATVIISDMLGRRVLQTELTGNAVDVSGLQPALYVVTIRQSGATATRKIRVE